VLRRVFALTPAAAMRAPAPPITAARAGWGHALNRFSISPPHGAAPHHPPAGPHGRGGDRDRLGMALSVSMITIYAGFDRTIDLTFNVVDRSDVTVSFTHAVERQDAFRAGPDAGVDAWSSRCAMCPPCCATGWKAIAAR
jgi:putative ABC transport system permease protein